MTFSFDWSQKNDGAPATRSPMERAINDAFVAFSAAGHFEWSSLTIEKLACDEPTHYPDICWHYRVGITR